MAAPSDDPIVRCYSVYEPMAFALKPDADARAALANALGIRGIKKLTFTGEIGPDGRRDLHLDAVLGATVVQDCVVTGDPVITRIDETTKRRYLTDMAQVEDSEIEMPEDENADPMPVSLDLRDVMAEALALALPPWPRATGVDPVDISVTEPGKAPMTDEDAKPFAALKSLRETGSEDDNSKG